MIYIPSRMGQLNRRALLRQLQKLGVASRAELAKSLGMSQPTAGKIVDELLALDVLEEVEVPPLNGKEHSSNGGMDNVQRGRPGRQLRLNQSSAKLLGIQLGVNETAIARLSLAVADEDEWHFTFNIGSEDSSPAKIWEQKLRAAAKKLGGEDFLGVLLSVPDRESTRLNSSDANISYAV